MLLLLNVNAAADHIAHAIESIGRTACCFDVCFAARLDAVDVSQAWPPEAESSALRGVDAQPAPCQNGARIYTRLALLCAVVMGCLQCTGIVGMPVVVAETWRRAASCQFKGS